MIKINMVPGGRKYDIKESDYEKMELFIKHAKDNMTSPYMFHLLSHIDNVDEFKKSKRNLIKSFERGLKKGFKGSKQTCPNVQVAYSIEFKLADKKEVNGSKDAYEYQSRRYLNPKEKQPFLHIHFHVIADCKKTNPTTFKDKAIDSLNEIKGLRAGRYFPSNKGELYKKVKDNDDDCFQRILYITKNNQKSDDIPFRKKFGISKLSNQPIAPF